MGRNVIETIMGAVVLLVAAGFMVFAMKSSKIRPVDGYTVIAKFSSASGLSTGSDVRIGGIKVGVVSDMKLDPESYRANVELQIGAATKIPADSTAAIIGDGLLGTKYVSIDPGADDAMLAAGGVITNTQSSVNLETLIGKFMFSGGGVEGKSQETKTGADAAHSSDSSVGSGAEPTLSVP